MGKSFIGLADDASASFANPAGLAYLRDAAVTLEYAFSRIAAQEGTAQGNINFGYRQEPFNQEDLRFFSWNFRWRNTYFSLYSHNFLDESQERNFTARTFHQGVESISSLEILLRLKGDSSGIGVARRWRQFKFGATLQHNRLQANTYSFTRELIISPAYAERSLETRIDSRQERWSWNAGVLYAHGWLSIGMVYRANPVFSLEESLYEEANGASLKQEQLDVSFTVPDVFGAGVAIRLRPNFKILVDYQHIAYSQALEQTFQIVEQSETDELSHYRIEDARELHAGLEYLWPVGLHVIGFRAGAYKNPNHFLEYIGEDPVRQSLFSRQRSDSEHHLTGGLGWAWRNEWEIGLSIDRWGDNTSYLLTLLWRKK